MKRPPFPALTSRNMARSPPNLAPAVNLLHVLRHVVKFVIPFRVWFLDKYVCENRILELRLEEQDHLIVIE